jgi:hypothetical protein
MAENPNLISCSCGNLMELEEGKVDLNFRDDNNKPITKEPAECMAKYRVRCPIDSCGKTYCTNP